MPRPRAQPGRFEIKPWPRTDHSGEPGGGGAHGDAARARLRENRRPQLDCLWNIRAGIRQANSGAEADPRFWASGISVIAHPWNPNVPDRAYEHALRRDIESLVRRRRRSDAGARPAQEPAGPRCARLSCRDARRLRASCDVASYEKYRDWCDEYFFLKHRNEPRGIGGIFFDYLNSAGDEENSGWDADFAFTRDVGESFHRRLCGDRAPQFPDAWTPTDREEQLVRRGRYVEFNLLYDRGTIFGLKTGGNVELNPVLHAAACALALGRKPWLPASVTWKSRISPGF